MPVALLQAYHRLDMASLQVLDTPMVVYRCCSSFQERGLMHYTALARLPSCLLHPPIDRRSSKFPHKHFHNLIFIQAINPVRREDIFQWFHTRGIQYLYLYINGVDTTRWRTFDL